MDGALYFAGSMKTALWTISEECETHSQVSTEDAPSGKSSDGGWSESEFEFGAQTSDQGNALRSGSCCQGWREARYITVDQISKQSQKNDHHLQNASRKSLTPAVMLPVFSKPPGLDEPASMTSAQSCLQSDIAIQKLGNLYHGTPTRNATRFKTAGGAACFQCAFAVNIDCAATWFPVVASIRGWNSENFEYIETCCPGVHVNLSGQRDQRWLNIIISGTERTSFELACRLVQSLICKVYEDYAAFTADVVSSMTRASRDFLR